MATQTVVREVVGVPFLRSGNTHCQNRNITFICSRISSSGLRPFLSAKWSGNLSSIDGFSGLRRSLKIQILYQQDLQHGSARSSSTLRRSVPDMLAQQESSSEGLESGGYENVPGSDASQFFYDELRVATAALKERVQAEDWWDSFSLTQPEGEGTRYHGEATEHEEPLELEPEFETQDLEGSQDLYTKRTGRIPIESNGPPMVTLQAYLAPDTQDMRSEKLPRLPLPMPHKLRPWGLPKLSLRSRLGIVRYRKFFPCSQDNNCVLDLAEEIRALSKGTAVSRVLSKHVWRLKRGSLAKTVRKLGQMHLAGRALQVLLWMQKRRHLWPDLTTLCTLLQVLVEAGDIETACSLQRTLGQDSPKSAETLAFSLATVGKFIEAIRVLNSMKQAGWMINGSVHTKLIQSAGRVGRRDIAEQLLRHIDSLDLNLTPQNYRSILASCSKLDLRETVERFFLRYKGSGLQPTIGVYTARISALTREGNYHRAVELIGELKEAACTPDLVAYQVMLKACAKLGDLDTANMLFEEMKASGLEATPDIYDHFIQLHHRFAHTLRVTDLMEEMTSRGFVPSVETLSSLSSAIV